MKHDPNYYKSIWTAPANDNVHSCGCIGPQNGEPLCPCAMRGVRIEDGRYVKVIDYGPVTGGTRDGIPFSVLSRIGKAIERGAA